ncbi:hypothetical protein VPHPS32B4_0079 [Vibrio phage PS32B-4]
MDILLPRPIWLKGKRYGLKCSGYQHSLNDKQFDKVFDNH